MPSLLANVANGTCPENCKCAVLFMDAIVQRTLKFVAFNGKDEPDISGKDEMEGVIPPTRVLWRKAAEIYWEEKSEQLSCELDSSLPVPPCMEELVGAYIKAVYLDDIPFAALGQSPISIASSSDATILMPKDTERADVDYPVEETVDESKAGPNGPNDDYIVEEVPDEQGPNDVGFGTELQDTIQEFEEENSGTTFVVRRPSLQLRVNQPQTTMTQYYDYPVLKQQKNKKRRKAI
jgi:hypothetical protein